MAGEHPPFFKYVTPETGRIVLKNRTLRWSTPGTLNDPYDMQFDLHLNFDRATVRVLALQKLWDRLYGDAVIPAGNRLGAIVNRLRGRVPRFTREEFDQEFGPLIDDGLDKGEQSLPTFQRAMRDHVAGTKVLCLTTAPDNIPMWTYYAQGHEGILLGFKSVPEGDSPWCMAKPIQYVRDMPLLMTNDFLTDFLSGNVSMNPEEIWEQLIYTKSVAWEHEQEWRISTGHGRNRDAIYEDVPFGLGELDTVTFGCRASTDLQEEIVGLVRNHYPDVRLFRVVRAQTRFGLDTIPFESA